MATYVGDLITEVRRDTDNVSVTVNALGSVDAGIDTEDFIRYMNFAQQRLQGLLISRNTTLFQKIIDFNIVAGTAQYTVNDNVYLRESIVDVQYSQSGNEADFRELREVGSSYRNYDTNSTPHAYVRRAGSIFLSPVPSVSQGKIRVTYYRALDRLDTRRGVLDAITIAGGAISANTLSIDTASDDVNRINNVTDKYICICDKDGSPRVYNIPYTAYSSGTGNFTHLAHTLGTGETAATGDYVTVGKYTTTHLKEIDSPDVERYLQLYCAVKIFRRDSSEDSVEIANELAAIETQIIENYQVAQADEQDIQIADPAMLDLDMI